jgi:hypothetical protein
VSGPESNCWLGVVSADHVARGVALGIAQIGHGKRAGLTRMRAGDGFAYYSPRPSLASQEPLRAFTAVGTITDEEIWQHHETEQFQPWRRRVTYEQTVRQVPLAEMAAVLELTRTRHWGYALRRGVVPLSRRDFELIRGTMQGDADQA